MANKALKAYSLFPAALERKEKPIATSRQNFFEDSGYAQEKWQECLQILKDNVSEKVFKTWFEPTMALSLKEDVLLIRVPSHFYYEWLEAHFSELIHRTVQKIIGANAKLQYRVIVEESDEPEEKRSIRVPSVKTHQAEQQGLAFDKDGSDKEAYFNSFNPRYSFDNFIRGDSNQLAASASMAVAEKPGGTRYNPLVIYGGTGLGKTHLASAIGNRILHNRPKARCLYASSERFMVDYVNALQENKINSDFNNFYRNVDVLIIDDVQFFSGKGKIQELFFHTFNALHQAGKQIILTSDKAPKELEDIEERLISRFQWGLVVDVQPPDYETRLAILMRKSLEEGFELPLDIAEFIAARITDSVRELEGALISLIAKVSLDKKELNLDLAREVVGSICPIEPIKLAIEEIKSAVCSYYEISQEDLCGASRKADIALARQMCMYLAKELTELSLKNIAAQFKRKDHTTAIHAVRTIQGYIESDAKIRDAYQAIRKKLR